MSELLCGRIFIEGGYRPAVLKINRKKTQVVFLDGTRVRVTTISTNELPRMQHVRGYHVPGLAHAMLKRRNVLGIRQHISLGARAILLEALDAEEKTK